jgi:uncharacterized membrane protein
MDNTPSYQGLPLSRATATPFWYSRLTAGTIILSLFLTVLAISYLIPPLQSPDEPAHLSRAYLLSKGEVFLGAHDGQTGGYIDSGLLAYMDSFQDIPFQYDRKLTDSDIRSSKRIKWSGHQQFRGLFNTAVYFPLPYLPQALAFAVGERMRLPIETTYYLTRLFALMATLGLLWAALSLYPTPPIVLALFVMPMTLFQLGSSSLDSVTFGTCALTASLFARGTDLRFSFDFRMHAALVLGVFSLATSRVSLIPLTLLPAVLYTCRRSHSYLFSSAVSIGLSLAWIVFARMTVQGMPSNLDAARAYLTNPMSFFQIFLNTLSNRELLKDYWAMFIGVLGWLDTPLDVYVYITFGILLFLLAILSIRDDAASWLERGNLALILACTLSLLFTFVIELLTWTPPGAKFIDGIQGRYFTPLLILSGYKLFGRSLSSVRLKWSLVALLLAITLSIVGTGPKLLHRYWLG